MNAQEIWKAVYLDDFNPSSGHTFRFSYIEDNVLKEVSGWFRNIFMEGDKAYVSIFIPGESTEFFLITNIIGIEPLWERPTTSSIAKSIDNHNNIQLWQKLIGEKVIVVHVRDDDVCVNSGILRYITSIGDGPSNNIFCFIDNLAINLITLMVKFSDRDMIPQITDFSYPHETCQLIRQKIKDIQ
jgi:hypothetical protein